LATILVLVLLASLTLAVSLSAIAGYASEKLIHPPHRQPSASPTDYGLEFESVSFPSSDGVTLRGWFIPAPNPKGTIVLCHGFAGDCSPDLSYAPLFREAGYSSLVFDFRGHGASDGDYTSLVFFERRDLLAALDFLRSRGITRIGLIGFSMGGAIALATAPQSPMVVGVISDCAFAKLRTIVQNAFTARGFPKWLTLLLGWLTIATAGLRLRANLSSADPIHWVAKIAPRPVLIMHGGNDQEVPATEARRLYDAAKEPKEIWIVPGASHRRIEEVAGNEYRRRVTDFFARAFIE
jgi:alpha-beta hydrolase superfamily lysophospholipase